MLSLQCLNHLYHIVSISFIYHVVCSASEDKPPDVLLCRQCGHTVVDEHELVNIKSPFALAYRNATVIGPRGVLVQTLRNPQGVGCDLITASKAKIHTHGQAYEQFSWFEGFSWKIAVCPSCQTHLGWEFMPTHKDEDPVEKYKSPDDYSFVGLILQRLIQESFADSLIITPKAYQR